MQIRSCQISTSPTSTRWQNRLVIIDYNTLQLSYISRLSIALSATFRGPPARHVRDDSNNNNNNENSYNTSRGIAYLPPFVRPTIKAPIWKTLNNARGIGAMPAASPTVPMVRLRPAPLAALLAAFVAETRWQHFCG